MASHVAHPIALKLRLVSSVSTTPNSLRPALVLENGQGIVGANSYASVDYARSYFVGRRLHSSAWTVAPRETQEIALKQASALLDSEFVWSGRTPVNPAQGLAWPFSDAIDRYQNPVVGVPKGVKDATCELAMYLMDQDRMVAREGVGLKSLRVDTISLVFDKEDGPQTFPSYISRMVSGLGAPVRGSQSIRTVKLDRV